MDNILVGDNGSFTLIDWATATVFGPAPRGWKGYAHAELRALDQRAVAKLKVLHAPDLIAPEEHELILRGNSRIYRLVKRVWGWRRRLLRQRPEPAMAPVVAKFRRQLEQLEDRAP
jgi:hypothetical protein